MPTTTPTPRATSGAPTVPVTIHVTHDDIRRGLKHSVRCCPVALAIDRQCPYVNAWVNYRTLDDDETLLTPPEVSAFLAAFDSGKPVEPFAFQLPTPLTL